jgi:hypothetical protein
MKVLFVGANPSPKNKDATVPFVGTQSGKILDEWIKILDLKAEDCGFINVSDAVASSVATIKKKDLNIGGFFFNLCMKGAEMYRGQPLATLMMSAKLQSMGRLDPAFEKQSDADLKKHLELIANTEMPKIVALGALATWGVEQTGVPCYTLPHPSGRNRKLNDKDALKKTLEECKTWLYNSPEK